MPVGAAIGVAGIGAGASVLSSRAQSRAAERGIEAQTEAAANSDRISLEIYQDQAARQEPFRQLGVAAINPFADLLGLDYQTGQAAQSSTPSRQASQPTTYSNYLPGGGGVNGFNNYGVSQQFNRRDLPDYFENGYSGPNFISDGQGGFRIGNNNRLTNAPAAQTAAPVIDAPLTQEQRTQNAFNTLRSRPGYQFQLSQGLDAIDQSAASRGMLLSGAQQRALTQYGQDYGSNAYDKELNRLSLAMGGGQVATNATNQAAGAYGAQTSANALNLGNARASAYQTQGQASANAFNGIAGAIGGGVGIYSGSHGWT